MTEFGACTIFTKNYLSFARVLSESFLHHHPGSTFHGLLCDRLDDAFNPSNERFTLFNLEEIGLSNLAEMVLMYDVVELCTAVKPAFLSYLFSQTSVQKLCYFDPDILILSPLEEINDLLDQYNIVIVPHLTEPQSTARAPNERQLLSLGTYNLGFIGLRRGEVAERFLAWWQEKLTTACYADPLNGLYVDQRWVDLVPGLFEGVWIHRDPGCDIAYWNLPERPITRKGGTYWCRGHQVKFFHFSGYSPDEPRRISKRIPESGAALKIDATVAELFETYRALLSKHGYETTSRWQYAFGNFTNGVPVPQVARRIWKEAREQGMRWPEPLNSEDPSGFYQWLLQPIDNGSPVINRLADYVYRSRPDVQRAFPDHRGLHRRDFARWYVHTGIQEHQIAEVFVYEMRASLADTASLVEKQAMAAQPLLSRLRASRWGRQLASLPQVQRIRRWLYPAPVVSSLGGQSARPAAIAAASDVRRGGLNVLGYLSAETGVGEVPRALIRALQRRSYPIAITHLDNPDGARRNDRSALELPEGTPYSVNLFAVNADGWASVRQLLGPKVLEGRRNIGFWFWEIANFPQEWMDRFQGLHEIWVGSTFVQQTVGAVSPIPVIVMGAPVVMRPPSSLSRDDLNLPADKFLFLYAFDMLSIPERKNPLGVVEAYRLAFGPHFKDTHLVLKANHLHRFPEWQQRLREAVASVNGTLIEETLDREHVNALYCLADAYVSLHRSEGFGLTVAEAMRMGKPVIATDYGGPHDFLNQSNGYPVRYRLVELERDYGPYCAGNVWADPDVEHAAELMQRVFSHPEERARKAEQAAQDIERCYGATAIADRVISRLSMP
ncbi:MAG: glycosyltransferase family 4 protein [Thermoflexales bacterium]